MTLHDNAVRKVSFGKALALNTAVMARGSAVALCAALFAASVGCAMESGSSLSPTSPSAAPAAPPPNMTLTVRVQARGSESPIPGALVRHEAIGYYTNALGESLLSVDAGIETTIEVSADGYHSMHAAGTLRSDERWTFYLEPTRR